MPGIARVIAGTGGSPGSLAALRYADTLACAHKAVLVPVLAWTPPCVERCGYPLPEWHDTACERLRDALLAVWGEIPASPLITPQVKQGPTGWVLVRIACQPGDILVIGAGRRGALRRKTRCSVSRYCAARARCPVVMVPPPELVREARLRRIARELTHRTLTTERILRDLNQPAPG
jgi:nucleotide-binding universal stress UspA family protein